MATMFGYTFGNHVWIHFGQPCLDACLATIFGYIFGNHFGIHFWQPSLDTLLATVVLFAPNPVPSFGCAVCKEGYTADQQGYTTGKEGHTAQQQRYTADQQGYTADQQGYTAGLPCLRIFFWGFLTRVKGMLCMAACTFFNRIAMISKLVFPARSYRFKDEGCMRCGQTLGKSDARV